MERKVRQRSLEASVISESKISDECIADVRWDKNLEEDPDWFLKGDQQIYIRHQR